MQLIHRSLEKCATIFRHLDMWNVCHLLFALVKGLKLIPIANNDYNEETGLRRHILCVVKRLVISIFKIEPLNPYLAQYLTKLFAKLMAYKALQLTRYP